MALLSASFSFFFPAKASTIVNTVFFYSSVSVSINFTFSINEAS